MVPWVRESSPQHRKFTFTRGFSNLIILSGFSLQEGNILFLLQILEQRCFKKTELNLVNQPEKLMLWSSGCCLNAAF